MNGQTDARGRPILLVEDDPTDVEAVQRALRRAGRTAPVVHCADGDGALELLRRRVRDPVVGEEAPGLVLLDLNLPGTDGREVLAEIKGDPDLRRIPVVILTSSRDERDVRWCYEAGANSYVQKPVDGRRFLDSMEHLERFWFDTAILPPFGAEHP